MAFNPTQAPVELMQSKDSTIKVCKDFIFGTGGDIHIHGHYGDINNLLSCVSTSYGTRDATDISGLYVPRANITPLNRAPFTLELLREVLESDYYAEVAHETAVLNGGDDELTIVRYFNNLMRRDGLNELNKSILKVILYVLSEQHDTNYCLGVVQYRGSNAAGKHFEVQVQSPSEEEADAIVWVFFDDTGTLDPYAFDNNWCALNDRPHQQEASALDLQQALEEYPPASPSSILSECSADTYYDKSNLMGAIARITASRRRLSSPDPSLERRGRIHNAPPRESLLPMEFITDITVEDIVVYYPEHAFHWPGLALMVNHYYIRSAVRTRYGWAGRIAHTINHARSMDTKNTLSDGTFGPVSRHTVRQSTLRAVRRLLGQEYATSEEKHTSALYKKVATEFGRAPTGGDIRKFLLAHLLDQPRKISKTTPPLPLAEVGAMVSNHLDTAFGRRVQQALRGESIRMPTGVDGQFIALLEFLGDDTVRKGHQVLDRTAYPDWCDENYLIKHHIKDLYGEVLLFVHRKYEMSDIVKRAERYHGITGKELKKFYGTLRKRKTLALRARADRLSMEFEVVQARYEVEASRFGYRTARLPRDANTKPEALKEIMEHKTERAFYYGKAPPQYRHSRKRERSDNDDGATRPSRKRARRDPNDLPPLPPISPRDERSNGDFPPNLGRKKGRYHGIPNRESSPDDEAYLSDKQPGVHCVDQFDQPAGVRHSLPSITGSPVPHPWRMTLGFDDFDPASRRRSSELRSPPDDRNGNRHSPASPPIDPAILQPVAPAPAPAPHYRRASSLMREMTARMFMPRPVVDGKLAEKTQDSAVAGPKPQPEPKPERDKRSSTADSLFDGDGEIQ